MMCLLTKSTTMLERGPCWFLTRAVNENKSIHNSILYICVCQAKAVIFFFLATYPGALQAPVL